MLTPPTTARDLSVRDMQATDAATIARLSGHGDDRTLVDRLARLPAADVGQVLIAEMHGQPVGWLHVGRETSILAPREAHVTDLIVDAKGMAAGAAAALLAAAREWARSHDCRTLAIRTRVFRSRPRGFFRAFGFRSPRDDLRLELDV